MRRQAFNEWGERTGYGTAFAFVFLTSTVTLNHLWCTGLRPIKGGLPPPSSELKSKGAFGSISVPSGPVQVGLFSAAMHFFASKLWLPRHPMIKE